MRKFVFIFTIFLFLISANNAFAQNNLPNNKFGIHINSEHDLVNAAQLVNSNGGEWGYVTLVIRDNEMSRDRWQSVFDQMRRLKLIPIVRIATHIEDGIWVQPSEEDARTWAEFLHSLNWPVKERLVMLFNEPNHAKEWGGEINPVEYADIAKAFELEFRRLSDDFKILPAALDLAAPNSNNTMEASRFWDIAQEYDTFLFTRFDYWNSHSYPNPGFSGKPTDTGKMSVAGYKWELEYLENLGLDPDIPVFITETGWLQSKNITEDTISSYYEFAFNNVWNDSQIKAVTPFLLNYEEELFSGFSWRKPDNQGNYKFFDTVRNLKKQAGEPKQDHSYELIKFSLAKQLVAQSNYTFTVSMKNTGQSIWSDEDKFSLQFDSSLDPYQINIWSLPYTEPGQIANIGVQINTTEVGFQNLKLILNKDGEQIGETIEKKFEILSPPSLEIKVLGWFGFDDTSNDYQITLSDDNRKILDIPNFEVVKGIANIANVYNVVPGNKYQLSITRDEHIAKSKPVNIDPIKTTVNFGRLLPAVSLKEYIQNPLQTQKTISLF